MIAQRLRTETASRHEALEKAMYVNEIMSKTLTLPAYKRILAVNLLAHELIEPVLFADIPPALAAELDLPSRHKLAALRQDAAEAGLDRTALPDIDPAELNFPGAHPAAQLGALYVLEGATLGGNVIRKQLMQNPELTEYSLSLAYYGIYGDALSTKWKQFQEVLERHVAPADADRCVAAANAMFDNLLLLTSRTQPAAL